MYVLEAQVVVGYLCKSKNIPGIYTTCYNSLNALDHGIVDFIVCSSGGTKLCIQIISIIIISTLKNNIIVSIHLFSFCLCLLI